MSDITAEFVRPPSSLKWLVPVFKSLKKVITEFIEEEEQPPYFMNEAASVSLLVAAGARSKYVVLSDYRTAKKVKGKYKNGRCDLLIERANGHSLRIEAKQTYVRSRPGKEALESKLRKAYSESKQLTQIKPGARAGLLFIVLSHSSRDAERFDLNAFKDKLKSIKSDLCWVWYDRRWKKYSWEEENRFYPGFAILLRK